MAFIVVGEKTNRSLTIQWLDLFCGSCERTGVCMNALILCRVLGVLGHAA